MRSENQTRIIQGDSMDENNRNIRVVKTGGRKVTKTTTEYDWSRLEKRTLKEHKDVPERSVRREPTQLERKIRYQKKQKQQRLKIQRRRALLGFVLAVILVSVLLFMTPIFNIRSVSVEGNVLVTAEQFQEKLKPLVGQNLFRSGRRKIRNTLKTIPYIDTVDVQKRLFPPSVKVTVTEYTPSAYIKIDGKTLLVNSELRVLTDSGNNGETLPTVTGLTVTDYKLGEILKTDENEKFDITKISLSTLEATGILDKVIEINVTDVTDITMNYDNRITVQCGTQLDLERKIRLFRETVMSNSLTENARGTMDLSESGKAIYTP